MSEPQQLYIQLFSPHGLIRSVDPEIGRDADTGGQVKYVLELMTTLSRHERVRKVDLYTRWIDDKRVASDYRQSFEQVSEKSRIVRIPCGGKTYRRKELLYPFLDEFVDKTIRLIKEEGDFPDVVHGHYADGNYVAMELSQLFGVPLISTGHSLGRMKKWLHEKEGFSEAEIEKKYNMSHRIEIEERMLRNADRVITSTGHEIETQYGLYESKDIPKYEVIPPGINTNKFHPYYRTNLPGNQPNIEQEQAFHRVEREVERFLYQPQKPLILSIARPNKSKNFGSLIQAYGEDTELRELANLAIFAGIRKDISKMPEDEQEALTELLLYMDKYDLYGKLAIPKKNDPKTEIPEIYRLAAWRRGVFINPAPAENFGLTLIEAAACGLPIIGTERAGPKEIISNCKNGEAVDVLDTKAIAEAIKKIILDPDNWNKYSENGVQGINEFYTWPAHCDHYIQLIDNILKQRTDTLESVTDAKVTGAPAVVGKRLTKVNRFFITDIDGTLIGEKKDKNPGLKELKEILKERRSDLVFGVATGRNPHMTSEALREYDLPHPDIVVCSIGTEIYYGSKLKLDQGWKRHISQGWDRPKLEKIMKKIDGIELQGEEAQWPFKLSFYSDESFDEDDSIAEIYALLHENRLRATVIYSDSRYLDLIPYRASKGKAVRYLSYKWNTPLNRFLTSGNTGNDEDMLKGDIRGVVVGNYSPELEPLRKRKNVYFAKSHLAGGIVEGMKHFNFLD